ncbi:MAG: Bug family tripartite tricarboxylate transporter substrate binding protein [Betaproteobacteria bacterium]
MSLLIRSVTALITLLLGLIGPQAMAQDYPARPIRLIVPFGPGGVLDIVGRAYAQALERRVGQSVVVENRPGASGNIGTALVATSPADGYTLLFAFDGTMAINPHVYAKPGFDPVADFVAISKVGNSTQMLVASPSLPAASLSELISKKGTLKGLSYGTSGTASPGHVSGEMLRMASGLELIHVPYKGGAAAVNDVMAGQIPLAFTAVATAKPLIESGKLKGLAVTTGARSSLLPGIQTFVEAGLADFVVDTWLGVMAPARIPAAIIDRLSRESMAIVADPDMRTRLIGLGVEPSGSASATFARQLSADLARWAKVVRDAGINVNP